MKEVVKIRFVKERKIGRGPYFNSTTLLAEEYELVISRFPELKDNPEIRNPDVVERAYDATDPRLAEIYQFIEAS